MAKPEVPPTVVQMLDGRTVSFAGKRRMLKDAKIDQETGQITVFFDFINGESRQFKIPQKLMLQFAAHGALQKYGDATASCGDDVDKAVTAVEDVDETIQSGNWNAVRDATAGGMSGASTLAKALVKVSGQTIEVVRGYLTTLDAKVKAALRLDPAVAAAIKEIEDEKAKRAAERGKAAAKIDVSATLNALKAGVPALGAANSAFAAGDQAAAAATGTEASATEQPTADPTPTKGKGKAK